MMYAEKYSADDLFDMFANQADVFTLARMPSDKIASELRELAPDMEDSREVGKIIRRHAEAEANRRNAAA